MKRSLPALLVLLIATLAPAQLVVGDIGVTGFFQTSSFTILHANGTSDVYTTGSFGGQSHSLLYDPTQPGTFLIGGSGFIGRVAVTGPGTATYTPITVAVGLINQMSWDGPNVVASDGGTGQIIRVDPATGGITPVTSGPQPWGTSIFSSCFDPNTGDIYVGGTNFIWRIPFGSTTPVVLSSGWTAGSSTVSGIVIDPVSLRPVATLLFVNRTVRIDALGNFTDVTPSGPSGCNFLDYDHNGDFIVGASFGNVYRVPNGGGAGVLIGVAGGITGAATSVAAVVDRFVLTALPFGIGGLSIDITGIPPGTNEGLTVASFDVSLPVGVGPIFGFNPDAFSIALVLTFPTPAPGNPIHWSWPVSAPLFPAAPLVLGSGTLPSGTTLDLIGIAINGAPSFKPTPAVRLTVN
jgi:hypothetical protein